MHLLPCHPCGTDVRIVVPKHVRERSKGGELSRVKWQVFCDWDVFKFDDQKVKSSQARAGVSGVRLV